MRELIIIGGGAAGITASIYAARKYLDVLLITRDFTGQIGSSAWIENYTGFKKISGLDLMKNFKKHLDSFDNIEVQSFEEVVKINQASKGFKVITDEGQYNSQAVIIATGSVPRKLGAKNEDKFLGKGLSYCLTCDEAAFKDRKVAVIGGGNAGAEAALELSRFSKKVYLMEALDNLTSDKILLKRVKSSNRIEVITSVEIKSFVGESDLEKITYENEKLNKENSLSVEGCFVEIGSDPNTEFVADLVKLNDKNQIEVDPLTFESSVEGVFAAGDATNAPGKQIVIACGQGASALLSAYKYLTKN